MPSGPPGYTLSPLGQPLIANERRSTPFPARYVELARQILSDAGDASLTALASYSSSSPPSPQYIYCSPPLSTNRPNGNWMSSSRHSSAPAFRPPAPEVSNESDSAPDDNASRVCPAPARPLTPQNSISHVVAGLLSRSISGSRGSLPEGDLSPSRPGRRDG